MVFSLHAGMHLILVHLVGKGLKWAETKFFSEIESDVIFSKAFFFISYFSIEFLKIKCCTQTFFFVLFCSFTIVKNF